MSATHEDWERAKEFRDNAARSAVMALLANDVKTAKERAIVWAGVDERMQEIEKELDRG